MKVAFQTVKCNYFLLLSPSLTGLITGKMFVLTNWQVVIMEVFYRQMHAVVSILCSVHSFVIFTQRIDKPCLYFTVYRSFPRSFLLLQSLFPVVISLNNKIPSSEYCNNIIDSMSKSLHHINWPLHPGHPCLHGALARSWLLLCCWLQLPNVMPFYLNYLKNTIIVITLITQPPLNSSEIKC